MLKDLSKQVLHTENWNLNNKLQSLKKNRKLAALFLLAFIGVLLLHVWTLMRYPAPEVDEAWLISRAWEFIRTGHAYGMLDSGLAEQFDYYWMGNQWFITAVHSLVLRFFSAPLLLPMRVFSLSIGIGLLIVNYLMAYRLLKTRVLAAFSTLLLATSRAFFYSAHMVRYDILAVFLIYTALALVLIDRKGRFLVGLIAGIFTGLAFETHLNSLVFIPVIGVCYLFEYGWQVWKKGTCWGYAFGCFLGLLFYLGLHYFPSPAAYKALAPYYFDQLHTPPILTWNLQRIAQELVDTGRLLLFSAGLLVIAPLFAIPGLITKRDKEASLIFLANTALITLVWLIYPNKFAHYAIYLAPSFLLMVTYSLSGVFQEPWSGNLWRFTKRVLVLGAVAGAIALSLNNITFDQYSQYQKDQALVNSVIKPTDVIMGPQYYWFGLYNHRYLSWETLFFYPRFQPGASIADSFEYLKPTIFIFDSEVQTFTTDKIDASSKWYYSHLPEKELMEYLNQNADLVLEKDDTNETILRVYRIHP